MAQMMITEAQAKRLMDARASSNRRNLRKQIMSEVHHEHGIPTSTKLRIAVEDPLNPLWRVIRSKYNGQPLDDGMAPAPAAAVTMAPAASPAAKAAKKVAAKAAKAPAKKVVAKKAPAKVVAKKAPAKAAKAPAKATKAPAKAAPAKKAPAKVVAKKAPAKKASKKA